MTCVLNDVCKNVDKLCEKCRKFSKFIRKKNKTYQARGRANKRAGKSSEKKLLRHLIKAGLNARLVAGSGAYKRFKKDADADLRIDFFGVEKKIENKKRKDFSKIRSMVEQSALKIKNCCYVITEQQFVELFKDGTLPKKFLLVPDKGFAYLHRFFEQDNADIVSLDEAYKDFIFCLNMDSWTIKRGKLYARNDNA